jgi:MFS family permease
MSCVKVAFLQRTAQTGTVVATLLTPIGSQFQASNQASYISTSYLLSVCCFTPLYGLMVSGIHCVLDSILELGRLADILGRKGAMLLALSLFGMSVMGSLGR